VTFVVQLQSTLVRNIAPTQPFRAALGAKSRVCYLGNTADRQTQWALTYCYRLQSTANRNGKLIHCHRWDLNLWSSGCLRTSLTTQPSLNPNGTVINHKACEAVSCTKTPQLLAFTVNMHLFWLHSHEYDSLDNHKDVQHNVEASAKAIVKWFH
jgi:hypothetical protein